MSKITGLGKAEWAVMMGSASFQLNGADAFVAIWPKDLAAPKPAWWPKRVADHLPLNEPVTVESLKALLPGFSEIVWEQQVRGMASTLEIHAVVGDLRIVITGHAKTNNADAIAETTSALREAAIEFQSLFL